MSSVNLLWAVLPIVLSAAGAWFLVREVSKAHEFEAIDREMTILKEMMELYRSNLREFWIVSAMESFNWDRSKAESAGGMLSDDDIRKTTEQHAKNLLERNVPDALTRWKKSTAPATLRWRKRKLWIGFLVPNGSSSDPGRRGRRKVVGTGRWLTAQSSGSVFRGAGIRRSAI